MPDDAKALFARYIDEVWVHRGREALLGWYHGDFVDHLQLPGMRAGAEGVLDRLDGLLGAFPDAQFSIIESVGEGDKVASLVHIEGTNSGVFMGLPATGNHISVHSFDISR